MKKDLSEFRELRSLGFRHSLIGLLDKAFPSCLILFNVIWQALKVLKCGKLTYLMPSFVVNKVVLARVWPLLNISIGLNQSS